MNTFLTLPDSERIAVFQDVADKIGVPAGYIEKDFWVCWVMEVLFKDSSLPLVFRGGTSLSKAYQIINRFSEDIDLSIPREWLGITAENDPMRASTKSQAESRHKALRKITRERLKDQVEPLLNLAIESIPSGKTAFKIELGDQQTTFEKSRDPYCFYLYYPSLVEMPTSYISSRVKIEFSAKAEGTPASIRPVQCFASEHYPDIFSAPILQIATISPERTFLEKAFIIHEENTSPESRTPKERLSRHYYDLYQLIQHKITPQDQALFLSVKTHRASSHPQSWVDYENITLDQFQITPPERLTKHWSNDYKKMTSMIYGDIPPLETIYQTITNVVSISKRV